MLLAFVFLIKAFIVYRKQRDEQWTVPWYLFNDDDTWFLFLAVAIAISALTGLAVGCIIFDGYSQPYYTLSQLHSYKDVDPIAAGKAYLDAGAIDFKKESFVDRAHAVGYKDNTVYCVAPIKLGSDEVANNDFFAVGTNCCSGFPGDFNCYEHRNDREAHGGLRIIDEANIPGFKLAASQAGAEFGKNSPNPIFLKWVQDPSERLASYYRDAKWTYAISLLAFIVSEAAIVGMMAMVFWKRRLWG